MLRSMLNRLTITLSPGSVTLVERHGGWRPHDGSPVICRVDAAAVRAGWQGVLAVLEKWLDQNKRAGSRATIVLDDCYARYALIPWQQGIAKQAEIDAYTKIYFEELFGDSAAASGVKVDWTGYAKPGIGCALDVEFVAVIRRLLGKHKIRVMSLSSYFVRAYNQWRSKLAHKEALFAVVGSGRCTLACFRDSSWLSLRSVRLEQVADAELQAMLERETVLQGLNNQAPIYLHMMEPLPGEPSYAFGTRIQRVALPSPATTAVQVAENVMEACDESAAA